MHSKFTITATFKNYKEISKIDFTNMFYSAQYIQILSFQHATNIKI